MNYYETIYVTRPDLNESLQSALQEKIKGILEADQGTIHFLDDMGKRKLAYQIDKEIKGNYWNLTYSTESIKLVAELERNLRINENVLRYLTVKIEKEDAERRPTPVEEKETVEQPQQQ